MWLLDDDNVLNNKTDLRKMVDILDTTDASLVGAHFTGKSIYLTTYLKT